MRKLTAPTIFALTLLGCSQHHQVDWTLMTALPLAEMHREAHGQLDAIPLERYDESVPLFKEPAEGYEDIRFETKHASYRLFDGELRVWEQGTGCFHFAPRPGTLMNDVLVEIFERLAKILDEIDFWAMEPSYAILVWHGEMNYIFARRAGISKVVWNYETAGPVDLWLYGQYFLYQMEFLESWYSKHPRPSVRTATQCIDD